MNIINLFQKTLVSMGLQVLERPVFYHADVGIRFEIGGEADVYIKKGIRRKLQPNQVYVIEAYERALTIFNALPQEGLILRIDLYDEREIAMVQKKLGLVAPHERLIKEYSEDGEIVRHYELYWNLDEIDWSIEKILYEVILADIGGLN